MLEAWKNPLWKAFRMPKNPRWDAFSKPWLIKWKHLLKPLILEKLPIWEVEKIPIEWSLEYIFLKKYPEKVLKGILNGYRKNGR